jgi:putative spermidine/putrescine transport system ATP-binding protein
VGVSNVVERDGRRFTIRPEKVRLLGDSEPGEGLHVEAGTVRDVAYVGMVTRYLVELEGGGELQVVRQNLETSSQEAQELRGRRVRVAWHEAQTFAIDEVQSREEGQP